VDPVLTGFAIAPSYQAQGFGKALMIRVIEHAQEQGLNIGLTALSGKCFPLRQTQRLNFNPPSLKGKPSFYAKVGFKEVSPPVMLANGTIEGVSAVIYM
jgi:GNAT superfamily N-acetyltransferase